LGQIRLSQSEVKADVLDVAGLVQAHRAFCVAFYILF